MQRTELVSLFGVLNSAEHAGMEFYDCKCKEIYNELKCSYEDIQCAVKTIADFYFSEATPEWRYICLNFYILNLINTELESNNEVLSVKQSKNIKGGLKQLVTVGILTKLQANLPLYVKSTQQVSHEDIFYNYNILKCATYGLCELLKFPNLRLLILPDSLKAILVGVYQICFCPLKKPDRNPENKKAALTQDIYTKLTEEREVFLKLLNHLRESIHPGIFVKETMVIFHSNAPAWFKKSISQTLTSIIRSKNGVEHIAVALLDGVNNDSAQTWKIQEVYSKLILASKTFPDFRENICKQVLGMLDNVTDDSLVFERLFVHCVQVFYQHDGELCKDVFLLKIVGSFLFFTYKDHRFDDGKMLADRIKQDVRLAHGIFFENIVESPTLPIEILRPVSNVFFRLYTLTLNTSFRSTNTELKDLLLAILQLHSEDLFTLFDSFFFDIHSDLLPFRNDVMLEVEGDNITLKYSEHVNSHSTLENSKSLLQLLENKTDMKVNLFGFLLNCLINRDKYFKKANDDLLKLDTACMNEFFERNLVVYNLLSDLAEDKFIQKHIQGNPRDIVRYINNVLQKTIQSSLHKTTDFETEGFQSVFTILMILQQLVSNSAKATAELYKILREPLEIVRRETKNDELRELVRKIIYALEKGEVRSTRIVIEEVKTELDKVIEEICDPLLPVRGHGLMALAKLVANKDRNVMDRKQYVLQIFQQNLKNDDSFIYLSAIGGLAAMADVFTDTVLNVLCEEYSDSSRKAEDGQEIRMKLGEILVRVTKALGDMAPKYKSLLLNTFLIGAKDEDYFIRASSLSNLGEICKVLGYKLGTIVTEVLVCVHSVIGTDKAPEARRAAVTVIRQLLAGLDSEMIAFLKDDILPIYRTLKKIYCDDKDDVMRLQAQLALEELNSNMSNFVFPKAQLNMEKKIVMLD